MRNHFLLEDIIFESRLDNLKKKYITIPVDVIEYFSKEDPSGNNKYLEFLLQNYSSTNSIWNENMINLIKDFHKNLQKIDTSLLDSVYNEKRLTPYLEVSETSPVGKTIKKVYKTPKDINSYMGTGGISLLEHIVKATKEKLSKSEVKELETNILYDSPDLKILIPESHRASCYYGSGTKWCTASKDSDNYFKSYTSKGTLFYIIDKKKPQNDPWYRTAIFVNKNDGTVQAFDAPDNPTQINVASKKLGDKWLVIRDTIVDYLYKIESKGIDGFYTGNELLVWYKSRGINPLKVLSPKELVEKIGVENLNKYLEEVGINPYTYFDFDQLVTLFTHDKPSIDDFSEIVSEIWHNYKKTGINPLTTMFNLRRRADFVIEAITEGGIDLDDFLNLFNDPNFLELFGENQNLFTVLNELYSGGSWTGSSVYQKLMLIFGDRIDLVWGYAQNFGINIFTDLDSKAINGLLKRKFKPEEALEYVFKNLDSINDKINNLGFTNEEILNYVNKSKDKEKLLNFLVSNKLLNKLRVEDYITLGKEPKEAFSAYIDERVSDSDEFNYFLNEILEDDEDNTIQKVFKNYEDFQTFIKNKTGSYADVKKKTIWRVFYNRNYYAMYSDFLSLGKEKELGDIFLINAYNDAPVNDKTELKEKIFKIAEASLKGNTGRLYLERKGDKFYVFTSNVSQLSDFFGDASAIYNVLELDEKNTYVYVEGEYSNLLNDDDVRNIVNEYLMLYRGKKIFMGLEFADEFDLWVEEIDREKDVFYFTLYDERILSLPTYLLEILIKNAPIFSNLNKMFKKYYDSAYKKGFLEYMRDFVISEIENIFGESYAREKTIIFDTKEVSGIQFRYDFLLDDIIAYAENSGDPFDDSELTSSVKYLITDLMELELGRFQKGYINIDLDYMADGYEPDEVDLTQKFVSILEEKIQEFE